MGYAFGAKVGSARIDGDMEFSWAFMDLEADSVIGTLFINKVDRFQGSEHDYNRLQLDVEFKFD